MIQIQILQKGMEMIADADRQGGIYPNHIFFLSHIRDGKWHESETLKNKIQIVDWKTVLDFLIYEKAINIDGMW